MTNATGKRSPSVDKLKLLQTAFNDSGLRSTDKLVLATLVTFHNGGTGRLDPGYDKIAKRASLDRRTVIRAIPRLAGYLTVTHRPLKRGNDTNTYRLAGVTATSEVVSQRTATAETATSEVVSQGHHPSVTGPPPPSVTGPPKQTKEKQIKRTEVPPLRHPPSSLNTGTTEFTSTDGASVENICLEAQAQPQQATSRDVACLQGVEGGQAQAERQHLASRDGAEKEQAVPPQQLRVFRQFDGGKPKQVKLDDFVDMLGGSDPDDRTKAYLFLEDRLAAIMRTRPGCTSERARQALVAIARQAQDGTDLRRLLSYIDVPSVTAA